MGSDEREQAVQYEPSEKDIAASHARELEHDGTRHGDCAMCHLLIVIRHLRRKMKTAPKTYEDGLREAFEAACKEVCPMCARGLPVYTDEMDGPFMHHDTVSWEKCKAAKIRAAQELGIDLSAAPDAEKEEM